MNASTRYCHDNNMDATRMPKDYTIISEECSTSGSISRDDPHNGKISVAQRKIAFALINAGLNGVDRQVEISGDTHVFGEVACAANDI